MAQDITQLNPSLLWKHFKALSDIPRPSKKEDKAIHYVKNFGKSNKLETHVDKAGNVVIRKTATPGMENRKKIVLQGHLDMVPQKNEGTGHDFETDPIQPFKEGEWVTARGITLGADNGIGVAAMLAILESRDIEHPSLEALFTVDEETGMTGAFQLKKRFITGDILFNLDTEEEGVLITGCAGGINITGTIRYNPIPAPGDHIPFDISISGLTGGHSGMDIHKGRGNANKLLNRFIWHIMNNMNAMISKYNGGNLRNAIPREAFATIMVPGKYQQNLNESADQFREIFTNELNQTDPDLKISITKTSIPDTVIPKNIARQLIKIIYGIPHGVIRMEPGLQCVTETSNNLAAVVINDDHIQILNLLRSSKESAKKDLSNMIRSVFELGGARVEEEGAYPGWQPDTHSEIVNTMKQVYKNKYGQEPRVEVVHAGLECGIIRSIFPHLDCISFGPVITGAHSPDERVNIKSVERFWDLLKSALKEIPLK